MEYDEILSTLQDAENTVATLRRLLGEDARSATGINSRDSQAHRDQRVLSRDNTHYLKYMDLSAVKLFERSGEEVFRIPDCVGLYFIVPGAPVRTAARSAVLRIVRVNEEFKETAPTPAFIQVGDWIYPLMTGSMAYRSEHKYYLFPDLLSTTPGSSVGVVLPTSATNEQRQTFESLLLGFLNMTEFPPQPPESFGKSTELIMATRTSVNLVRTNSGLYSQSIPEFYESPDGSCGKRIGTGIKAGGQLLSRGIQLGAKGTATAIGMGATCLLSVLKKEEGDCDIPPCVVDSIVYARDVTGRVVDLSSTILSTLSAMTSNLASLTACWVKNASAPVVQKCIEASGVSQETVDEVTSEVKSVGEGLICGVAETYHGLEVAAKVLGKALSNNTVEVVTHCYGRSAAHVLVGAGQVVGNVTMTGVNTSRAVNAKAHVSRTTKKMGLAIVLEDCRGN